MNDLAQFYKEHWNAGAYGDEQSDAFQVEIFRNMFPGYEEFVRKNFVGADHILDAGCGDGTAARAFFGEHLRRAVYQGIDTSGIEAATREFGNRGMLDHSVLLRTADIYKLPFPPEEFDWVFCVGVLHYLPDIYKALECLTRVLDRGGHMVLWLYKEQPPIRRLTDDYLRRKMKGLSPEEAKEQLKPLTDLGIALGGAGEIAVPDVPLLGIPAGDYSIQRLFYYYIMKLFYHPGLSFERHLVNNWNAFYPQNVSFLSESEVGQLLVANNLDVVQWNMDGNGHAIIARKA